MTHNEIQTKLKKSVPAIVSIAIIILVMQSCYSVRISNANAVPEKKPIPSEASFYRDKLAHEKDTTIKLKVIQSDFTLIDKTCPNGFYSVEYKVSFGYVLLNLITFGKVRKVKIKYVCNKKEN